MGSQLGAVSSALDLGLLLHDAIMREPARLGLFARTVVDFSWSPQGGSAVRNRDVLPLPPPALHHVDMWLGRQGSGAPSRKNKKTLAMSASVDIWSWLIIVALDYEYVGRMAVD